MSDVREFGTTDYLRKTEFAKAVGVEFNTLDRWLLKEKITPAQEMGGVVFFHRDQIAPARKLKRRR